MGGFYQIAGHVIGFPKPRLLRRGLLGLKSLNAAEAQRPRVPAVRGEFTPADTGATVTLAGGDRAWSWKKQEAPASRRG